ncbi:MAG TPA: class I SAM-dependent methyltransferase [Bacteroidales bacterium]|jgi:predicted O-methyltransferase YrrM|nr:class I SAM-dependent methyltransferase [Bacteroidales bacterium]
MLKKVYKTCRAIIAIINNPWLLNLILEDNNLWCKYVISKYDHKNGLPVVQIEDLFDKSGETLNAFAFLDGGSLVTDYILLKKLASQISNCSYFEIGTWRGESAKNVSEVANECYTLNLSDKEIRKLGKNENYVNSIGIFSNQSENIIHLKGNSFSYNFEKLNKKFDLIFIDGDHHFESVKNDTLRVFEHLVHENTIVVWHDYGFSPEKIRYEVLAAILDGLPEEKHKNLYSISNTLCAIYSPKKLNADFPMYPIIPKKKFRLSVYIENI